MGKWDHGGQKAVGVIDERITIAMKAGTDNAFDRGHGEEGAPRELGGVLGTQEDAAQIRLDPGSQVRQGADATRVVGCV